VYKKQRSDEYQGEKDKGESGWTGDKGIFSGLHDKAHPVRASAGELMRKSERGANSTRDLYCHPTGALKQLWGWGLNKKSKWREMVKEKEKKSRTNQRNSTMGVVSNQILPKS